jgi:hypothetical protein
MSDRRTLLTRKRPRGSGGGGGEEEDPDEHQHHVKRIEYLFDQPDPDKYLVTLTHGEVTHPFHEEYITSHTSEQLRVYPQFEYPFKRKTRVYTCVAQILPEEELKVLKPLSILEKSVLRCLEVLGNQFTQVGDNNTLSFYTPDVFKIELDKIYDVFADYCKTHEIDTCVLRASPWKKEDQTTPTTKSDEKRAPRSHVVKITFNISKKS